MENKINCVFMVEDNDTTCQLEQLVLSSMGVVNIFKGTDGTDCINLLSDCVNNSCGHFCKDKNPIVILDWQMSPMDGLECLGTIRNGVHNIPKDTNVIMLTGYKEEYEKLEPKPDVDMILFKPFSIKMLYNAITTVGNKKFSDPRHFIEFPNVKK